MTAWCDSNVTIMLLSLCSRLGFYYFSAMKILVPEKFSVHETKVISVETFVSSVRNFSFLTGKL